MVIASPAAMTFECPPESGVETPVIPGPPVLAVNER